MDSHTKSRNRTNIQAPIPSNTNSPSFYNKITPISEPCLPPTVLQVSERVKYRSKSSQIVLNIGGVRFETTKSTLKRIPGTRLSKLTVDDDSYDAEKCEYFFDRHSVIFSYILNFYRTGELHLPSVECGPLIQNELKFWDINEGDIAACCWLNYSKYIDYHEQLKQFDDILDVGAKSNETLHKMKLSQESMNVFQYARLVIWNTLEMPHTSTVGKMISFLSLIFTMISIITIMLETYRPWYVNTVYNYSNITNSYVLVKGEPNEYFKISDYVCIGYFSVDFLIRLLCCQSYGKFFKSFFALMDFLTLVLYYSQVIARCIDSSFSCLDKSLCENDVAKVLHYLQLLRIISLFKIFKNFSALKVLACTLKSSIHELLLIIVLLLLCVLVFSCLIFFVEGDPDVGHFQNIPIAFWFSLITMTTVGYGDLIPKTIYGYVIASCCSVCGVLLIAFTVPIAVNNFTIYYTHAQSRLKNPNLKKSDWKRRII